MGRNCNTLKQSLDDSTLWQIWLFLMGNSVTVTDSSWTLVLERNFVVATKNYYNSLFLTYKQNFDFWSFCYIRMSLSFLKLIKDNKTSFWYFLVKSSGLLKFWIFWSLLAYVQMQIISSYMFSKCSISLSFQKYFGNIL